MFERIANGTDGYAPINISKKFQVVGTKGARPWPTPEIINEIHSEVAGDDTFLLDAMRRVVISGKLSYVIFVAISMLVVGSIGVVWRFPQVVGAIPIVVLGGIYACIAGLVWYWAYKVDERMESAAQTHWQRHRKNLRGTFMQSREERLPKSAGTKEPVEGSGVGERDAESQHLKEGEPIPA